LKLQVKVLFYKVIGSRYFLWLLLAIPSPQLIYDLLFPGFYYYPEMMQKSGIISIQLLVFTLSITPITLILKPFDLGKVISRWLLAKRKYFGLAAAVYALIHTILYMRYILWDVELAWLEALDLPFATGWIAMILFILVSIFSNQWGVRTLAKHWKNLQRLSYIIAVAALVHWLLLDFFIHDAMEWIIPLAIAKLVHVGFRIYPLFAKA